MRIVRSLPDVQKVLNELLDFKSRFETRDLDLGGRRVRNAGTSLDKDDYVTRKELPPPAPEIPGLVEQPCTIYFSTDSTVTTGQNIPAAGCGRTIGFSPIEVWMYTKVAPTTADLVINVQLQQKNPLGPDITPFSILDDDLTLSMGSVGLVSSRTLITPPPKFGEYSMIWPIIVSGGDAAVVTIGVVCKRIVKGAA